MKTKLIEIEPYQTKYYRFDRNTKEQYGPFDSIEEAMEGYTQWNNRAVIDFSYRGFAGTKGIQPNEYLRDCVNIPRTRIQPQANYCVVDEFGDVITLQGLRDAITKRAYRNHGYEVWERENHTIARRLTSKKGSGKKIKPSWAMIDYGDRFTWNPVGSYRIPKTHHERTANVAHENEYRDEFPRLVRRSRLGHNLPDSWSDYSNSIWETRKSWKHHSKRKRQWIAK